MNKRQLKKMSRVAADWMVEAGEIYKSDLVCDEFSDGEWQYFECSYDGECHLKRCIDFVMTIFWSSMSTYDFETMELLEHLEHKGVHSMSQHKRLLFAVNYMRAKP